MKEEKKKKTAAQDRRTLIRLASTLPVGDGVRRVILSRLGKDARPHPLGDRAAVNKETHALLKGWVARGVRDWGKVVSEFYLDDLSKAHGQIADFEKVLGAMKAGITDIHGDYIAHSDYQEFYDDLTDAGFYDLEQAIEGAEHDLTQMIDNGWADEGYESKVQEEIEDTILPALETAMDDFKKEYGIPPRFRG